MRKFLSAITVLLAASQVGHTQTNFELFDPAYHSSWGSNYATSSYNYSDNANAYILPRDRVMVSTVFSWIGSEQYYYDHRNESNLNVPDKPKAMFDGDINTFYDGPSSSNGNGLWNGLSFDQGYTNVGYNGPRVCYIKFRPRQGYENRMRGGQIQVSDNPNYTNAITVYTIPQNANLAFKDYYLKCTNPSGVNAKYVRYVSPNGGWGNIAELEFYSDKRFCVIDGFNNAANLFQQYNGVPYISTAQEAGVHYSVTKLGSSGSWDGTSTKEKAFDEDPYSYFDAPAANGQWVGYDLGTERNVTCVKIMPRQGYEDRMSGGVIQVSTDANFTNPLTLYTMLPGVSFKSYYIGSSTSTGIKARYVRYLSPNGGWGNIAEFEVYTNTASSGYTATKELTTEEVAPSIYPNPVTNVLNIDYAEKINSVRIMSVDGRVITPNKLDEKTVDCSNLAPGVYILMINNKYQLKFTKS